MIGVERHLPYERPPLSKALAGGEALAPKVVASAERFIEAGIKLILDAEVTAIDRAAQTVMVGGEGVVPYRQLLLATGAAPRRLPAAEATGHCFYLRTFDDAQGIRARLASGTRVAIIGGGFIGLELAAVARQAGAEITLLEMQPRLLMRGVPAEVAEVIRARHETAGVTIHCGVEIAAYAAHGNAAEITLRDGRAVVADLIVAGIGAVPNVALAEAAGLAIDNGIAVDDRLQTSDRAIFAAGDCTSFPLDLYGGHRVRLEAWRNAQEQGELAAKSMLGMAVRHEAVPWFWSDQYDLGLQIAGLPDAGVEVVRRELGDDAFILFHTASDGRLVAASGIGPGNAVARDIRIAEMLIARRAAPSREALATAKLKSLLSA